MHGNPLVILTAYIPHDLVQEEKRLSVWESLSNCINLIPPHKNLIILGDFNAQLHTRKEGKKITWGHISLGREQLSCNPKKPCK
eukprot:11880533-Heterocapsa_arctica.AAC.1